MRNNVYNVCHTFNVISSKLVILVLLYSSDDVTKPEIYYVKLDK